MIKNNNENNNHHHHLFLIIVPFLLASLLFSITALADSQAQDFKVRIVDVKPQDTSFWHGKDIRSGDQVDITAEIINVGGEGCMKVEAGIYSRAMIAKWYGKKADDLFSIFNLYKIDNCNVYETNVKTYWLCLDPPGGESNKILKTFTVKAPLLGAFSGGEGNYDYGVHAQAFKWCWNEGYGQTGQTSYDAVGIYVLSKEFVVKETCVDGILNQDETDTDCGGKCPQCGLGGDCKSDDDCQHTYSCEVVSGEEAKYSLLGKQCVPRKKLLEPPNVTLPPPLSLCGNDKQDLGETPQNCPEDFPKIKEEWQKYLQKTTTIEQITSKTPKQLLNSVCSEDSDCESENCIKISYLIRQGYLDKEEVKKDLVSTKTAIMATSGAAGAFVGIGGALLGCSTLIATGPAFAATLPLCIGLTLLGGAAGGVSGVMLGEKASNFFDAIKSEDPEKIGYCLEEEEIAQKKDQKLSLDNIWNDLIEAVGGNKTLAYIIVAFIGLILFRFLIGDKK